MSWSKVKKGKKPFMWWVYKVMCELNYSFSGSGKGYYKYLNKLCKYGFNLYGEKL